MNRHICSLALQRIEPLINESHKLAFYSQTPHIQSTGRPWHVDLVSVQLEVLIVMANPSLILLTSILSIV